MKISSSKLFKLSFFAFAFTFFLASCKKDNADVVKEEVIGKVPTKMKLTIGSRTIEYNAYATYCNVNGKTFFNVSNNKVLLDSNVLSSDFRADDFLVFYAKQGTQEIKYAGASFNESTGGINFVSVVFDPSATVTIIEANSLFVKGSITGVFTLQSGAQAPYTAEFTAEVIRTSPFCN